MSRSLRDTGSLRAWANFRQRVVELGGEVLEPEYLGRNKPHRCLCAARHECTPNPGYVQQGGGLCLVCAGQDPATAWADFRQRVAELGGEVLEPEWLGGNKPHRCRCASGHECAPRPGSVQQGRGLCRVCAGRDSVTAWFNFRQRVAELGGEVIEPEWLGKDTSHRCRCASGHECTPRPGDVQHGEGLCRICAGQDPATAWANFRQRVAELDGVVLEPEWLGNRMPHHCRCVNGHECTPVPGNVQQGRGLCRICAGKVWDAFYVVVAEQAERLKFGITSGDPRPRLRTHKSAGYDIVVRLLTALPGSTAPDLERAVLATLRLAEIEPVRGREHYPLDALPVVLDVVDNEPR